MSEHYESYPREREFSAAAASQDEERRVSDARAKADAARAAVERRRSMSAGRRSSASVGAGQEGSRRASSAHSIHQDASGDVIMKYHPGSRGATPIAGRPSAAHEDEPADYDAAMEEIRRKQARLAEDDENIEERLQLYSEVVALRKELVVVQEDEERLRRQLADTESIIAARDPEVAKEVAIFEDEAQQSSLQKVWAEEANHHNPDTMEWAEIDVNNLRERVDAAHARFVEAQQKADSLESHQQHGINATTDAREQEKAAIAANHEREMESLNDARARARQVASEDRYHRHRGTARGTQLYVPKEKKVATRARGIDEVEYKTTAQVAKMKDELAELMEQVRLLKRQLDDSRTITADKKKEYEVVLQGVEEEGAEAREMQEKLLKEEEELKALRSDIQGVLHYVRAKNREEDNF